MVNVVGLETVLDQETEDQRAFAADLFATNAEIKAYFTDGDEDLSGHVERLCLDGIREGVKTFKKKHPVPGHEDPPILYAHSLGYFWHDYSVRDSIRTRLESDQTLQARWESNLDVFADQLSRTVAAEYLFYAEDRWNKSTPSPQ